MLKTIYHSPPTSLAEVKAFWTGLAKSPLLDPTISGKSYRTQVIDILSEAEGPEKAVPEFQGVFPSVLMVNGRPVELSLLSKPVLRDASGNEVILKDGFEKYQPFEIVGDLKPKKKKKERDRALSTKKSVLTKESQKFYNGLRRRGVSKPVLEQVKNYLESFLYPRMQEIAASIVYVTCEISEKEARSLLTNEKPEEISDSEDSSVEENDSQDDDEQGDDDDDGSLPDVIQPED